MPLNVYTICPSQRAKQAVNDYKHTPHQAAIPVLRLFCLRGEMLGGIWGCCEMATFLVAGCLIFAHLSPTAEQNVCFFGKHFLGCFPRKRNTWHCVVRCPLYQILVCHVCCVRYELSPLSVALKLEAQPSKQSTFGS